MTYTGDRGATRTKIDAQARPLAAGVLKIPLAYTNFSAVANKRATAQVGLPVADLLVLGLFVEGGVAFGGGTIVEAKLDVGDSGGDANEFASGIDLIGSAGGGKVGTSAGERGTASDGRNAFLKGTLVVTLDVGDGGAICTELTAGSADLYLAYMEVESAEHVDSAWTPSNVTDPGEGAVGLPAAAPVYTSITSAASPYTPAGADTHVEVDATGGNTTVQLPTAATLRELHVGRDITDLSSNTVTILPDGSDTIATAASATLAAGEWLTLVSDGVNNWSIV